MSEHAPELPAQEHETDEPVVVTSDDVTIEQIVGIHHDDVAKVEFKISSEADGPVRVELIDELPEAVRADAIGFHPEYHDECWQLVDDRTVAFESEIATGEPLETLYGVRIDSRDELALLTDEPTVETAPLAEDDTVDADEEVETTTGASSNSSSGPNEPTDAQQGQSDGGSVPESVTSSDRLIDALVAELRQDELDDEQQVALVRNLGFDPPNSIGVRLRHIQETIDDLVVYRDALEEFIDENGSAEAIIEKFEAEIEDVRCQLESVENQLDRISELEAQVEASADEISAVNESVTTLREDHTDRMVDLDDRQDELESKLDASREHVLETVEELRDDLEQEREWRENLREALGMDPTPFEYSEDQDSDSDRTPVDAPG